MPRKKKDDPMDLTRLMKAEHLKEPPQHVLRKAMALGSQLQPKPTLLETLVELVFDSGAQPLPAGVRGVAVGERRLLYRVESPVEGGEPEEGQVDLRLRRDSAGALELTGQLLPPWPGASVEVRSGRAKRTAKLGDAGEFLLRGLPGKTAPLTVWVTGKDRLPVRLSDVPLPEDDDGSAPDA